MPDPYASAIQQALQRYAYLKRFAPHLALTQGTGPYQSESYLPQAPGNPSPGNYTVQLRSQQIKGNPQGWSPLIAREGLDWLARTDPAYQKVAQSFRASMSPSQLADARKIYNQEKEPHQTFEDFLKEVQVQEYIGGYVFPESSPGWTGPRGEGKYTSTQMRLLDSLKAYLNAR